MNKKYLIGATGLLAVGAISSIAVQSFAQSTPSPSQAVVAPSSVVSSTTQVDTETNDDASISSTEQTNTVEKDTDVEVADDGGTALSPHSIVSDGAGENPND
ncbi:MAG: hypothetical protein JWL92_80 [Candidatus Nomurabacteria bacterium]|nr:hypothetical protein [Candidatus Nomurabacteria bacterium]